MLRFSPVYSSSLTTPNREYPSKVSQEMTPTDSPKPKLPQ